MKQYRRGRAHSKTSPFSKERKGESISAERAPRGHEAAYSDFDFEK